MAPTTQGATSAAPQHRKGGIIKRFFDLGVAIPSVIILSPLLVLLAVLVKLGSRGPVFFRQERPGLGGRPFRIIKFRTMTNAMGPDGKPLPDGARLTGMGRFLRKWSLDEIPELLNVIRGEMSFVGPRPLLMQYLPRYTPEQARRHDALPGVTGWAQINGRNATSWDERFRLDVWYVDNRGFWLDLRILFITVFKVLKREGISAAGHDTMPEFMGSETAKVQR